MSVAESLTEDGALALGALVVLGLALWYAKSKVTDVAGAVGDAIKTTVPYVDPSDQNNLAYRSVNGIGSAITGNQNFDLGTSIYDGVKSVQDTGANLGGWLYDITH